MAKKKKEESLVGRSVSVSRGEADSRTGILLADQKDHLVLYNGRDGIVYYTKKGIQGFTPYDEEESADNSPSTDGTNEEVHYFDGKNFSSILASLLWSPVRFNRGNEDQVDGILAEVGEKEAVLVNGNEVRRLPLSAIRDIGDIVDEQQGEEEVENQEEEGDEANDNPASQRNWRKRHRNNRHSRR
ncbi:hypothetical protein [Brevibacillus nitrificans]|uniref:hypothetical protein n=1 Tax=Brevibacillus nitrificans TaxID=651560 RepID=UPI002863967B|nr:hypothetical protein [Brevibacillus nitrificans]MDR7315621.1 hypothetical protein [Brevibacillus nitrificans]